MGILVQRLVSLLIVSLNGWGMIQPFTHRSQFLRNLLVWCGSSITDGELCSLTLALNLNYFILFEILKCLMLNSVVSVTWFSVLLVPSIIDTTVSLISLSAFKLAEFP